MLGSREPGLVGGRRQVGFSGSEGRRVVRDKLDHYQAREITREISKEVRVPGKPEQGWVGDWQGQDWIGTRL